jgi:hypothetical protein
MKNEPEIQASGHKNQLIAKPYFEAAPKNIKWLTRAGIVLICVGASWAVALFTSITPNHFLHLLHQWTDAEKHHVLEQWAHFGHAISGPFELITIGTIVFSFAHVIHQLRMQEQSGRIQFQPVVTCAALLYYNVEGTERQERINIAGPHIKLRLRNLGDSPATFVVLEVERLTFVAPDGSRQELEGKLKTKSIYIDSLGQGTTEVGDTSYDEAELPASESLPEDVSYLIDSILDTDNRSGSGSLELRLGFKHENVMGLRYQGVGTFVWSKDLLSDRNKSDQRQIEYIHAFQSARRNNGHEGKTIGQFIKNSYPLQAALKAQ